MSSSLRKAAALLAAVLVSSVLGGCAQEGTTPSCNSNLTKDGIDLDPDGCEQFGQCRVATIDGVQKVCTPGDNCPNGGDVKPANVCCCPGLNYTDGKGEQITFSPKGDGCVNDKTGQDVTRDTSNALEFCLYGYGAIDISATDPGM